MSIVRNGPRRSSPAAPRGSGRRRRAVLGCALRLLAVLKVVGVTAAVLLSGAALYVTGSLRARRVQGRARTLLAVSQP